MKHVICPYCGSNCMKYGRNKSRSQRWFCRECHSVSTPKIDNAAKQLNIFLNWLFGRDTQKNMPGEGRTFRRNTGKFWGIWPLPSIVEKKRDVLHVDGIYLARKACILICCDDEHVLGWYLCRYEHAGAWRALLSRIAEPKIVVSDGGCGFNKARRQVWPNARHQRCIFHVFSQIKRYTTTRPKSLAGYELYCLAKELFHLNAREEADAWTDIFLQWMKRHYRFLSELSYDEYGNVRHTHERLLKAERALVKLVKEGAMFTYLDESLKQEVKKIPATNNRIEGGINAQLRAMLRDHRGLSIERRIKAVFWWCYMHSPEPLSASEILKRMPTDKSIAAIYDRMHERGKVGTSIPQWGDAVVWGELHRSEKYPSYWD